MRVLINASFKALRTGTQVQASEEAGEFIFDSESDSPSVATLLEIAKKNGATIKRAARPKVVAALVDHLESLELPTMNDVPDSEKVKLIVAAGVEENHDDDTMLVAIIKSGIKFKLAGKLFAKAMAEGGYRITGKARKSEGRELLIEAEFQPETYAEVQAMNERICAEINDTVTSQANSIIRAYAKEYELELPKPEKKASGGIKTAIFDFLKATPGATAAELLTFVESKGPYKQDDRASKLAAKYEDVRELTNAIAA